MKIFFKYIYGLLLVLIIGVFILDTVYTAAFHTGFARNKTQYAVQLKESHIDYIFLGSSRVENHIDCELITELTGKSCLNLGLQGSRVNDSASLLQILKDNDISYKKVFYQLDYSVNSDGFSPAFLSSLMPFVNDDNVKINLLSKLELTKSTKLPFLQYATNDKIVGFREVILQYYGKPSRQDLTNGYDGRDGIGVDIKGELPSSIKENNSGILWMQELEPKNLVFFTAPYCKEAINRDLMIKDLKDKYPSVTSFINIFDDKEMYFADCGYLNNKGAKSFTRILTQDLLLN
ncbi:hypothetical protein [uncultured Nonlabens sp.]|uniref:hypothetical protein n=1 Tax=uncultured Nonlabens sp. TaxID=859306 RepID=UPI002634D2DB|nr:hypothetical protein [uncultured Nonlabens sp.]